MALARVRRRQMGEAGRGKALTELRPSAHSRATVIHSRHLEAAELHLVLSEVVEAGLQSALPLTLSMFLAIIKSDCFNSLKFV